MFELIDDDCRPLMQAVLIYFSARNFSIAAIVWVIVLPYAGTEPCDCVDVHAENKIGAKP